VLSKGKYQHVYHNDCKAEVIRQISAKYPAVKQRLSCIQPSQFVTNWKINAAMVPEKQSDGSFVIRRPFKPDDVYDYVVAHKDSGKFVQALLQLPPGVTIDGTSERLTCSEWAELWGRVLGVKAVYQQVSYEEFFKALPEEFAQELMEAFMYIEEFTHTGGDPNVKTLEQVSRLLFPF
jgi:hypothetical protein